MHAAITRGPIVRVLLTPLSAGFNGPHRKSSEAIIRPTPFSEGAYMKLVRFSTNGQSPRLGMLDGDRIARPAGGASPPRWPQAASLGPRRSPKRSCRSPRGASSKAARPAQEAVYAITERVTVPATRAGCMRPIHDPGKFICIGLNYRDHAEEAGQPIPKEPPIFPKWNNTILDPGEPILRPRGSRSWTGKWSSAWSSAAPRASSRGAGARLRVGLHEHQRRERARLPVHHEPVELPARSPTRSPPSGRGSPTARRSPIPTCWTSSCG